MGKYWITDDDIRLSTQSVINLGMRISVYNIDDFKVIDQIEGGVVSGSISISVDSDIRRTASLVLIPNVQDDVSIRENKVIWLDKKIKIEIGIMDLFTQKYKYWSQGYYVFMNASLTYDITNNQLTLSCSDLMSLFDGSKSGELPYQSVEIPAYKTLLAKSWYEEAKADGEQYIANVDAFLFWASKEDKYPNKITTTTDNTVKTYVWKLLTEELDAETVDAYVKYIEKYYGDNENFSVSYERSLDLCTLVTYNNIKEVLISWLEIIAGADTCGVAMDNEEMSTNNSINLSPIMRIGTNYEIEDIWGNKKAFPEWNSNYEKWRSENPEYASMPYDLTFDAGSNVLSVLKGMIELYDYYEMFFDIDGTLIIKRKPMTVREDPDFSDEYIHKLLISENSTLDMSAVRNIVLVYGKSIEMDGDNDFYAYSQSELSDITKELDMQLENLRKKLTDSSLNLTSLQVEEINKNIETILERKTYYQNLEDLKYTNNVYIMQVVGMEEGYYTGDRIAFKPPANNKAGAKINVNGFGDVPIYDPGTAQPITADMMEAGKLYTLEIKRKYNTQTKNVDVKAELLGVYQAQGVCALVSSANTKDWVSYFKNLYSVERVKLMVDPESPFTVEKIGELLTVCTGDTYGDITSDALALDRAEWELYNKARLTDNISLTLKICPFLDVNHTFKYTSSLSGVEYTYLVQSVSHDFNAGTTSITASKFFDYYVT